MLWSKKKKYWPSPFAKEAELEAAERELDREREDADHLAADDHSRGLRPADGDGGQPDRFECELCSRAAAMLGPRHMRRRHGRLRVRLGVRAGPGDGVVRAGDVRRGDVPPDAGPLRVRPGRGARGLPV